MAGFKVNNGGRIFISQEHFDGDVTVTHYDGEIADEVYHIKNGDFVMLLNFYRYIKDYDIQHDFINPNGKEVE